MTTPEPLPQSELERIKALCEDQEALLKECKSDVRDIVRFSAEALVALPKCVAEIERLKEELVEAKAFKDEEHAIVQKVWKALGKETYSDAKPFTIWEWVEKDKETITRLQTELAEARKDKERLNDDLKIAQGLLKATLDVGDLEAFRQIESTKPLHAKLAALRVELETIRFNAEAALKGAPK